MVSQLTVLDQFTHWKRRVLHWKRRVLDLGIEFLPLMPEYLVDIGLGGNPIPSLYKT